MLGSYAPLPTIQSISMPSKGWDEGTRLPRMCLFVCFGTDAVGSAVGVFRPRKLHGKSKVHTPTSPPLADGPADSLAAVCCVQNRFVDDDSHGYIDYNYAFDIKNHW